MNMVEGPGTEKQVLLKSRKIFSGFSYGSVVGVGMGWPPYTILFAKKSWEQSQQPLCS